MQVSAVTRDERAGQRDREGDGAEAVKALGSRLWALGADALKGLSDVFDVLVILCLLPIIALVIVCGGEN